MSVLEKEKRVSRGVYSRYPLSRAASLLWPHLPINPQEPTKIMTKWATIRPKYLWDVTVRLSHELKALKLKCTSTHAQCTHSPNCISQASLIGSIIKTRFFGFPARGSLSKHCRCSICSARLEPQISALGVCSFEQWSLLGDGDVHKCSPTHLIGLKCPFKLNSQGAAIKASPNSAEQRHGCWLRICEVHKEVSACIGYSHVKEQRILKMGSIVLERKDDSWGHNGKHWKPERQIAEMAIITSPLEPLRGIWISRWGQ